MSIAFRIFVLLFCAYAGWETASINSAICESLSSKGVLQPDKQGMNKNNPSPNVRNQAKFGVLTSRRLSVMRCSSMVVSRPNF